MNSLSLELEKEPEVKSKRSWKMHFNRAQSRSGADASMFYFTFPLGDTQVIPQVIFLNYSLRPLTMC